jgi:hypothetical protein
MLWDNIPGEADSFAKKAVTGKIVQVIETYSQ